MEVSWKGAPLISPSWESGLLQRPTKCRQRGSRDDVSKTGSSLREEDMALERKNAGPEPGKSSVSKTLIIQV